jgi:hypothetical protein
MANWEPFDEVFWPDLLRIVRVRRAMIGGSQQKFYDASPGAEFRGRARPRSVTTDDGSVITIWDVRTPGNPTVNMDEMILFVDASGDERRLVAEGPSVPKNEMGTTYLTECIERI